MGKEFLSGIHSQRAGGFSATTRTCLGKLFVPLGQSQKVLFFGGGIEFLHQNAPELQGKDQRQSQVD